MVLPKKVPREKGGQRPKMEFRYPFESVTFQILKKYSELFPHGMY